MRDENLVKLLNYSFMRRWKEQINKLTLNADFFIGTRGEYHRYLYNTESGVSYIRVYHVIGTEK